MLNHRKVFLLGIDGLPPSTFNRFVAEGRMPHFARLLERGAVLDVVPTLPALTAPGWLSIASGAHPSTVGIENILLPTPGQAPDVIENGFNAARSEAEYIWETLGRSGLNAIVLKYPGSWPPRPGTFVQVDGAGGYADISCRFEVASSQAYTAGRPSSAEDTSAGLIFPTGYRHHWRIDTGAGRGRVDVVTRNPMGWQHLAPGVEPVFECVVHLQQRARQTRQPLHGLAYRSGEEAHLMLSPNKDFRSEAAIDLCPGAWSAFVQARCPDGPYTYRFKLLDLNLDRKRFHLYRTEGHRLDGFTRPVELANELVHKVGPVVEWTGTYDLMNGLVDLGTQFEIYEQHTDWMARAVRYLGSTRPWNGFFTHWHVIEYAHHLMGASLHSEHPLHESDNAVRDLDFLGRVYGLADRLLEAVEAVVNDETLVVVASDHGHDLIHSIFYINHFLRRSGWLAVTRCNGKPAVDWTRTVAYALFPGCVYFNTVERWPGGIVKAGDTRPIAEAITEALRSLVDPRTGRHPIQLVLNREELSAFGQEGPRAPDLFFCMDRGYEPASRIHANTLDAAEFEVTVPYTEVTSGHGSFFPFSPSARTLALLAGPGIEPGSRARYPVSVIDLAPTMTEFLGIPPPRNCEGRAINL